MKRAIARLKAHIYFRFPFRNRLVNAVRRRRWSGLSMPETIYIETTNYCNARCYMCPHEKMARGRGTMSWEVFARIVEECRQFEGVGLNFILHKDGEPLMDSLLFKRIAHLKSVLPGSRIHFNTNAMLLTEEKVLQILDSGLDSITFSVDGASPETYEKIRRGLNFETVNRNIRMFFRKKEERGSKISATMQMIVTKENEHEIPRYREQWGDKADRIFFKSMHSFLVQGTSLHGSGLSDRQLQRCMMPFRTMLFYWNGDVALCCWDYDNLVGLGNINQCSLLELYNGETFNRVRVAMAAMSCTGIEPCRRCSQIYGMDGPLWQ